MWEMITWAMAGLGSAAAAASEEDLQELQSAGSSAAAAAAGEAGSAAAAEGAGSATDGAASGDSEEEAEELVEYEGMLVSAAAAQRRRWAACNGTVACGALSAVDAHGCSSAWCAANLGAESWKLSRLSWPACRSLFSLMPRAAVWLGRVYPIRIYWRLLSVPFSAAGSSPASSSAPPRCTAGCEGAACPCCWSPPVCLQAVSPFSTLC